MKKIIFFLLFLLSINYNVFAEDQKILFNDVSYEHWAYNTLNKLINKYNIKMGYKDNSFRGDNKITRYEVAALILEILEKKTSFDEKDKNDFDNIIKNFSYEIGFLKNKLELIDEKTDVLDIKTKIIDNKIDDIISNLPIILSGSIGNRYELIMDNLNTIKNNQLQSRIELNIISKEQENINYGLSLLTGDFSRPVNTWWRFGDFYANIPLNVSRFFLSYKPLNYLELKFGKFNDIFSNSEIYLDEEINTTGFLQSFSFRDINQNFKELSFNFSQNILNMDSNLGNAFSINSNIDFKYNFSDLIGLNIKGAYYHYIGDNLSKIANSRITGNKDKNSIDKNFNYNSKFNILNIFSKLIFRLNEDLPISLSFDYLYNLGTNTDNKAYQISTKIGNTNSFFLGYNFKYLEKDSTLSVFVEDQLGSTDVLAHEGIFGLKIFSRTILSLSLQSHNNIKSPLNNNIYTLRTNLIQGF